MTRPANGSGNAVISLLLLFRSRCVILSLLSPSNCYGVAQFMCFLLPPNHSFTHTCLFPKILWKLR
jgi:hypothetical protein